MLEFKNVEVTNLERAVISCRNAMRLEMVEYTKEEFEASLPRAIKLVQANNNKQGVHCHANFRTGINVTFDMKYTQYITKQFQRYHWFQYVSSSSMMHRITKMDFSKCCNKYVTQNSIDEVNMWKNIYNYISENKINDYRFDLGRSFIETHTYDDAIYTAFMMVISNCPMGTELFVHVDTNYEQLATIYRQRKHHKLKEDYKAFTDMVESLPYAKELIIGNYE